MKRLLIGLVITLLICGIAEARVMTSGVADSNGTDISSYTITGGGPEIYSTGIDVSSLDGNVAVQTVVASGAEINLLYQVSTDNTTFYYPYVANGASSATVATAITSDRVLDFAVENAPYMRLVIQPLQGGTLTLKYVEGIRELGGSTFVDDITLGGTVAIGATAASYTAGPLQITPPATQVIAAGNTIAADGCGTFKSISSVGAVTTSTSATFTAPTIGNEGCCMDVINVDDTDAITLDNNGNFHSAGAADVVLGPYDSVRVCCTGALVDSSWIQISGSNN